MGLNRNEALDCFASDDLIGIGMEADAVRRGLHPEGVVSYTVDREIDVAEALGEAEPAGVLERVQEAVELGGTGVRLRGGVGHGEKIESFERLLRAVKARFPAIWLQCFSASEILEIADHSKLSVEETLVRLKAAGLGSITGRDAAILEDTVRRRATRRTCRSVDWLETHRTAHRLGIRSAASVRFGMGETLEQRVDHLEAIRALQAETGGFTSFTPLAADAKHLAASGRDWEEPTSVEYLTTLAVSRLMLDNVANVQASWENQGLKVVQMALRFGANDVGAVGLERSAGGPSQGATEEELRRLIRDAGFRPVQRDTVYGVMYLG
jgi:cyclic dehypoxanthinyl futalosine synthase